MKVIINSNNTIQHIISKQKKKAGHYRLFTYCVNANTDDGLLFLNILTRELIIVGLDELEQLNNEEGPVFDYLVEQWFYVPVDYDDYKKVNQVRSVYKLMTAKKYKGIKTATIFTTTDCNAHCFYCYELGRSRIPMSEETAHKTARYLIDNCIDNKIKITWFGGEPLYNKKVIDIICDDLSEAGISYSSVMISNAYLFDDSVVESAVNKWNLKNVQITLDGTEEVYNKAKAFHYNGESPFKIVTDNIERILKAGIKLHIRLNIGKHNIDDLTELVDYLIERYSSYNNLKVYIKTLFEEAGPITIERNYEERKNLHNVIKELELKLNKGNIGYVRRISSVLKNNRCMADSNHSVTITPNGNLGLCEHYSESEFIGHIDSKERDESVVASFKELIDELPECRECYLYPECVKLKKCPEGRICHFDENEFRLDQTRESMRNEYAAYLKKEEVSSTSDDDIDC